MTARYVLKNASGWRRFISNLKAGDNETILASETYSSRQPPPRASSLARPTLEVDARYERRTNYFVLKAANGEVIGRSEEYSSNAAMEVRGFLQV